MLDSDTKARIDSARDILVGKVPDPKSQVEQITIALIYKFMDDMDRQSEELNGKATFFSGEFKKYRWANLLDKRLGGHERLILYAESIEKMNENRNIPQLFRDIFRGVFLPYRDPETLNLFLKEIAGFSYDHSERLGDAYEYLLSVLGTQGDAGQFRTPRHIIDFIVSIVDPRKNETVLDPACGTAGFLISAFKHIARNNENLTPDERARLMTNFRGYDIAPDMVRLSRVNLYLHGFPNPVIHEYDTLTSEERWDERCDVIMANPPFMTPKGGIRPHNRFSIKAKRSEVLFVDYIAEHLNPSGRAGIIVPEGIIFQGQNAYKNLRRMLVENYLWAVVSLPAGVFNPYSGVKTSVLFLNLNLAKRMDDVLFVKVQNDGFDLGAQRRPIEGSDLTSALRIIENHKKGHRTEENRMAHAVSRKRILESTDVGLSGDRYRPVAVRAHDKWPMVKLGEIAMDVKSGFACGTSDDNKEGIPHLRPMNISTDGQLVWEGTKYISKEVFAGKSDYLLEMGDVLFNNTNSKELVGKTCLVVNDLQAGFSNHLTRIRSNPQRMRPALLALFLHYLWRRGSFLELCNKWIGQAGINNTKLVDIEIPIPPIEEQERIVAELEGYRKVIDGARQVIANYKPAIRIDPEWLIIPLGDVITLQRGYDLPKTQFANGDVPVVGSNGIIGYHDVRKEEGPGVVTGRSGTIGKVHFIDYEYYWPHNTALFVRDFKGNDKKFIMYLLQSIDLKSLGDNVAAVPSLDRKNAHRIPVPLPPLDVQRRIVAELEAERKLVEANRDLIARMEARIRAKLAEVWGDVEE